MPAQELGHIIINFETIKGAANYFETIKGAANYKLKQLGETFFYDKPLDPDGRRRFLVIAGATIATTVLSLGLPPDYEAEASNGELMRPKEGFSWREVIGGGGETYWIDKGEGFEGGLFEPWWKNLEFGAIMASETFCDWLDAEGIADKEGNFFNPSIAGKYSFASGDIILGGQDNIDVHEATNSGPVEEMRLFNNGEVVLRFVGPRHHFFVKVPLSSLNLQKLDCSSSDILRILTLQQEGNVIWGAWPGSVDDRNAIAKDAAVWDPEGEDKGIDNLGSQLTPRTMALFTALEPWFRENGYMNQNYGDPAYPTAEKWSHDAFWMSAADGDSKINVLSRLDVEGFDSSGMVVVNPCGKIFGPINEFSAVSADVLQKNGGLDWGSCRLQPYQLINYPENL